MIKPNKIDTIIFDLDGTIVDTEAVANRAVRETLQCFKIRLNQKDSSFITGRKWEDAFDHIFHLLPELSSKRQKIEAKIRNLYHQLLKRSLKEVPGASNFIKSVAKTRAFRLGLVSGSSRKEVFWALTKLGVKKHFHVILGSEDYANSKPSPEGYRLALRKLKTNPRHCLSFEDSAAGIQSARSAGLWVIAVTSTNHFNQDQKQAHDKIKNFLHLDPKSILKRMEKIINPGKINLKIKGRE